MAIRLADAEIELAEAKEELDKTLAQMAELGGRMSELRNVVIGWQAIIAAKRGQQGAVPAEADGAMINPPAELTVAVADQLPPMADQVGTHQEDEEGENKTQFVRDYIRDNAGKGVAPADLKKAARAAGMRHAPSWPYGPLQRLKKSKQIIKRKGRFYPGPGKAAENAANKLTLVG